MRPINGFLDFPSEFEMLLEATVLLALAWVIHFAFQSCRPKWRILLWRCMVFGICWMPILNMMLPSYSITMPFINQPSVITEPLPSSDPPAELRSSVPNKKNSANSSVMENSQWIETKYDSVQYTIHISDFLFAIWLLVFFLFLIRMLYTQLRILLFARQTKPVSFPIQQLAERIAKDFNCQFNPQVRYASTIKIPFLLGWFRPVILLPQSMATSETIHEVKPVLAHEISHYKSCDIVWMAAIQFLQTILWFHPLMWFVREAHDFACEAECDAAAASYIGNTKIYSQVLAQTALNAAGTHSVIGGIPMAKKVNIRKRLELLNNNLFKSHVSRPATASFVALAMTLILLVSSSSPFIQPTAAAENAPQILTTMKFNFEDDNLDGWTYEPNRSTTKGEPMHDVQDGALVLENARMVIGKSEWKNYVIEGKMFIQVLFDTQGLGGIGLRRTPSNNRLGMGFYSFYIMPGEDVSVLDFIHPKTAKHHPMNGIRQEFLMREWYTFRVKVQGNYFTASINDQYYIDSINTKLTNGAAAIEAWNARVKFDDVVIKVLEPDPPKREERIPKRSTEAPENAIDLSNFYTHDLRDSWLPMQRWPVDIQQLDYGLSSAPSGLTKFDGIPFDIRGLIQLNGKLLDYANEYPQTVQGIPVNQTFDTLHTIHAFVFSGSIETGTTIGSFVMHYNDGTSEELNIVQGVDAIDWWYFKDILKSQKGKAIWTGKNEFSKSEYVRNRFGNVQPTLYKSQWHNPHPQKQVESIDIQSSMGEAAPFVLALTVE